MGCCCSSGSETIETIEIYGDGRSIPFHAAYPYSLEELELELELEI